LEHCNERVEVACGRRLCERREQTLVSFRGSGKQVLFLCDVLSRTFKELAARRLLLSGQLRNIFVIEVENVPQESGAKASKLNAPASWRCHPRLCGMSKAVKLT
jgi:hypothetical protein